MTMFGIVTQLSKSSTSGRNRVSKNAKRPPKCHFLQMKLFFSRKVSYLINFDLPRPKICVINTLGEQLPVKKRVKIKKIFKMAAKSGHDVRIETISFILLHLTSLM